VLFGLVVVKVFIYDSSFLERFYRIVSFSFSALFCSPFRSCINAKSLASVFAMTRRILSLLLVSAYLALRLSPPIFLPRGAPGATHAPFRQDAQKALNYVTLDREIFSAFRKSARRPSHRR